MPATVRDALAVTTSSGNTQTLTLPAGRQVGDLIVVCWAMGYANQNMSSVPSGWTYATDIFGLPRSLGYLWKVLASGDPSAVTFTTPTSAALTYKSFALYDFDPADPVRPAGANPFVNHGAVNSAARSYSPYRPSSKLLWWGVTGTTSTYNVTWSDGYLDRLYNGAGNNFNTAYAATDPISSNTLTDPGGNSGQSLVTGALEVVGNPLGGPRMMM